MSPPIPSLSTFRSRLEGRASARPVARKRDPPGRGIDPPAELPGRPAHRRTGPPPHVLARRTLGRPCGALTSYPPCLPSSVCFPPQGAACAPTRTPRPCPSRCSRSTACRILQRNVELMRDQLGIRDDPDRRRPPGRGDPAPFRRRRPLRRRHHLRRPTRASISSCPTRSTWRHARSTALLHDPRRRVLRRLQSRASSSPTPIRGRGLLRSDRQRVRQADPQELRRRCCATV